MLYALGVGFMRDPLDEKELPFAYENNGLKVVPTFASVINRGEAPPERQRMPQKSSINFMMVVDGERRITFHKPLGAARRDHRPTSACSASWTRARARARCWCRNAWCATRPAATSSSPSSPPSSRAAMAVLAARSDGGPELHPIPDRAPDLVKECDTRPDQAFLYALSGDRNPLHRDPAFAKAVGFPRPILHGLCSYGTACRAILSTRGGI